MVTQHGLSQMVLTGFPPSIKSLLWDLLVKFLNFDFEKIFIKLISNMLEMKR